jgi:hypothetical protein
MSREKKRDEIMCGHRRTRFIRFDSFAPKEARFYAPRQHS